MANSHLRSNADIELDFHRALVTFSTNIWDKPETAKVNAETFSRAFDELLKQQLILSDELIGYIAITINTNLCPDYKLLYGLQQRSLPLPKRYNREEMKDAFPILYDILRRIDFERVHQRINGTFFCVDQKYLYICPRRPPKKEYQYTHGMFVLPDNRVPRYFSLENVQHVVHDLEDLMSILNSTRNETITQGGDQTIYPPQNITAEFTGGTHHVYHGPNLLWFGPLLSNKDSCSAFNPNTSCYGSYRFSIPFKYLLKYTAYILGTRKYDEEYCHTILFTNTTVESVKLKEELQPIALDQTKIIGHTSDGLWKWLCYRWDKKEYDQLDFALAANSLKFDPTIDGIRLDFVDHQDCMRNKYNRAERQCIDRSRTEAMKEFLSKLIDCQIDLSLLKLFFDNEVYEELQTIFFNELRK